MERIGENARVYLTIEGRVQGVFFRASTVEEALKLGLKGWVRNSPDGSVEVVAEGAKHKIEELARWCHRGPPGAHVRNVMIRWENSREEFQDFRIKR